MTLSYSDVPINHESVIVSKCALYQNPEIEASNGIQPSFNASLTNEKGLFVNILFCTKKATVCHKHSLNKLLALTVIQQK